MPNFIQKLKSAFFGTPRVIPLQSPAFRQGTGTKIAQQYGHPDALVLPDDMQRLFAGEWVLVSSSWIAALHYEQHSERSGSLRVRLLNGKEYGPTAVGPAEMGALASAPSKGHTLNKIWKRARP